MDICVPPLIWRLRCLWTLIIHSAMTKWRCSKCSERIWSISRLALSTQVPCDPCVWQATHSQQFNATMACGEAMFLDVIGTQYNHRIPWSHKPGLPTWGHHLNHEWHKERKADRLLEYEKWWGAWLLRTAFGCGSSPEQGRLRVRRCHCLSLNMAGNTGSWRLYFLSRVFEWGVYGEC